MEQPQVVHYMSMRCQVYNTHNYASDFCFLLYFIFEFVTETPSEAEHFTEHPTSWRSKHTVNN